LTHRNAGKPTNPDAILEAVDGSDDGVLPKRLLKKKNQKVVSGENESEVEVIEKPKQETDEEELGKLETFGLL
jgi:hypothetical protein